MFEMGSNLENSAKLSLILCRQSYGKASEDTLQSFVVNKVNPAYSNAKSSSKQASEAAAMCKLR